MRAASPIDAAFRCAFDRCQWRSFPLACFLGKRTRCMNERTPHSLHVYSAWGAPGRRYYWDGTYVVEARRDGLWAVYAAPKGLGVPWSSEQPVKRCDEHRDHFEGLVGRLRELRGTQLTLL